MKIDFKKWKIYEESILNCLKIYFEAHRFIRSNSFSKYFIVSGLAFLILFTISINVIVNSVNYIEAPVTEKALPFIQKYLNLDVNSIEKSIQTTFWIIKKLIESNKDTIFSFIFLIIGTPFFSFISAKTEEINEGKTYPFKLKTFLKELKRGLSLSIRNTFKQLGLLIIITLIGLIPVIGIINPLLSFIIQSYFNGILMIDYTLERKGISVKESERFFRENKSEMFAIGLGFMFLLLIPVIGWFLAPTYGIVASYLFYSKRPQNQAIT